MSSLSKEHFDKQLHKLATKSQLKGLDSSVRRQFTDHANQLKDYTNSQLKQLEERLNVKLDAIIELLDVQERVVALERQVSELMKQSTRPD